MTDYRNELTVAARRYPKDAEAILRVVKRDTLDKAGEGRANPQSMIEALGLAAMLAAKP